MADEPQRAPLDSGRWDERNPLERRANALFKVIPLGPVSQTSQLITKCNCPLRPVSTLVWFPCPLTRGVSSLRLGPALAGLFYAGPSWRPVQWPEVHSPARSVMTICVMIILCHLPDVLRIGYAPAPDPRTMPGGARHPELDAGGSRAPGRGHHLCGAGFRERKAHP